MLEIRHFGVEAARVESARVREAARVLTFRAEAAPLLDKLACLFHCSHHPPPSATRQC